MPKYLSFFRSFTLSTKPIDTNWVTTCRLVWFVLSNGRRVSTMSGTIYIHIKQHNIYKKQTQRTNMKTVIDDKLKEQQILFKDFLSN